MTTVASVSSIYPYQSEAAITEALKSDTPGASDYDIGLDYVVWVVGWEGATAYDGTDGNDQSGTYYRSARGDSIYVVTRILAFGRANQPLVAVDHATTFFDETTETYDTDVTINSSPDGWTLEFTAPPQPTLTGLTPTKREYLIQFESTSYEGQMADGRNVVRLGAQPHTWGSIQISLRDQDGRVVGWYAAVVPSTSPR